MSNEESIFTVIVTESELTLLLLLSYREKRQLFLANMESNQGRDKEALARRESAAATVQLSEKLVAVGAKEGDAMSENTGSGCWATFVACVIGWLVVIGMVFLIAQCGRGMGAL